MRESNKEKGRETPFSPLFIIIIGIISFFFSNSSFKFKIYQCRVPIFNYIILVRIFAITSNLLIEMTPSVVGYTVMRGEKVAKKSFQTNR